MNTVVAYFMSVVSTITDRFEDKAKGATAVEYGLMVALIAVVIIVAVSTLGDNLAAKFEEVATEVGNAG